MFHEMVREQRRQLGMTQEELAVRTGISVRSIGNLEAGRTTTPRPVTMRLLADAFGLTGTHREHFCRSWSDPDATVPLRASSRRPLADELFLIGHDQHRGKAAAARLLGYGLAGAALGELVLARQIDVSVDGIALTAPPSISATTDIDTDPVSDYLLRELADEHQRCTLTLQHWIVGAAVETYRRVGQRLAQADLVIRQRRRGKLRYLRTAGGHGVWPDVRVTRYLLEDAPAPDLQTRLLIALIDVLNMQSTLALDLTDRELQRRMAPAQTQLPPGPRAIVESVNRATWQRTVTPRP